MSNTKLQLYVAVAEIAASVAVVASLAFVVISLNQNTEAVQSANDNFLYQLESSRMADVTSNSDMAELVYRANSGEELSGSEKFRFEFWVLRQVNIWDLAFNRHSEGMMPPSQWRAWDDSFRSTVVSRLSKETWDRYSSYYGREFRNHVDAAYAEQ